MSNSALPRSYVAFAAGGCLPPGEPDVQYWLVLSRALHETDEGDGVRDADACAILREGIEWLPNEVDLYLQLGQLLEASDTAAAVELYVRFPPPPEREEPSFNHAVLANSAVRLLLGRRDYGSSHLVAQLTIVGRVLGVLSIEKHVMELDRDNQLEVIKEAYMNILPDVDQTTFFRSKGWERD